MQNKNNSRIKHYSILGHKIVLLAYLIIFFFISAFVFPWVLKHIYILFSSWESFAGGAESGGDYLSLLPDFLGGLCGILIAALLDSMIISRLSHIKKFEALMSILWDELSDVREQVENTGSADGIMPGGKLATPILDGIISSHESMSIIHNLPRYFFWEEKGAIAKEVCDLATDISNINNYLAAMINNAADISADIINASEAAVGISPEDLGAPQRTILAFYAECCNFKTDIENGKNAYELLKNRYDEEVVILEYLGKGIVEEKRTIKEHIDQIEKAFRRLK